MVWAHASFDIKESHCLNSVFESTVSYAERNALLKLILEWLLFFSSRYHHTPFIFLVKYIIHINNPELSGPLCFFCFMITYSCMTPMCLSPHDKFGPRAMCSVTELPLSKMVFTIPATSTDKGIACSNSYVETVEIQDFVKLCICWKDTDNCSEPTRSHEGA